jgi:hypothetical protein
MIEGKFFNFIKYIFQTLTVSITVDKISDAFLLMSEIIDAIIISSSQSNRTRKRNEV